MSLQDRFGLAAIGFALFALGFVVGLIAAVCP